MAGTPTTTTSSLNTSKTTGSDKESPRLSIGQKKTQARLSTTIDDYDNYDDTDYEAIAQEMREEEDETSTQSRFVSKRPSHLLVIPPQAGIQRGRARRNQ